MADDLDGLIDDILEEPTEVPTEEPAESFSEDGSTTREGYAWAQDCYWVADHLGDRPTKAAAGSAFRFSLWKFAKSDTDNFIRQMMPKAMTLLEKARDRTVDDNVIAVKERKSIAALRELLETAVAESELVN